MIFLDFLLDMYAVNTMLLNEDICFAGTIFVVSVVSLARQLARGAFGKLVKDAEVIAVGNLCAFVCWRWVVWLGSVCRWDGSP